MKTIPFFTLEREYSERKKSIDAALQRVVRSQQFILGHEGTFFEKEFASYLGAKFVVGVASGTDGLVLALHALGVGPGDEVITQSNSFVATAEAVAIVGATIVFADIDADTYQLDIQDLKKKITKKTKVILPVHMYGAPAPMNEIRALAKKHSLFVVEDACQAHGAMYGKKKLGTLGDIGVFSFYPSKNLGAYGDAGCVVTNSTRLHKRIVMMRNHGQNHKYIHEIQGINSRLDELQAAVLRVKLTWLDPVNREHRHAAMRYRSLLSVKSQEILPSGESNFYVFVIQVQRRDQLQRFLHEKGIQTLIHYPVPIHLQKPFSKGYKKGSLPVTEYLAESCLSLPLFPGIRDEEISEVCKQINAFYA
ncbi:MAG: hypothetical protein RLZZ455_421 [Candidatus Parcubacteria bacterium]|jgi:dTDP-4-amino-4,6-dideoxygalactose transaminase